jgi:Spy/CpxP family protein refolding chaperone
MNKKLTLIGLILSLAMPLTAFAAEDYHHAADNAGRVAHLTKSLGLTADQQTKVKALFDAQEPKLKAVHEETKTALYAILTPEQTAKLEAAHAKHGEKLGKTAKQ